MTACGSMATAGVTSGSAACIAVSVSTYRDGPAGTSGRTARSRSNPCRPSPPAAAVPRRPGRRSTCRDGHRPVGAQSNRCTGRAAPPARRDGTTRGTLSAGSSATASAGRGDRRGCAIREHAARTPSVPGTSRPPAPPQSGPRPPRRAPDRQCSRRAARRRRRGTPRPRRRSNAARAATPATRRAGGRCADGRAVDAR